MMPFPGHEKCGEEVNVTPTIAGDSVTVTMMAGVEP